ncbi:hypothetical protein OS493_004359 [Desmophyllum pertusum]|uniref:Uncharacterized protein n=1 Tax=Desmophyllum pertusum TaxID=174260 RepID=A0A9W9ZTT8_9CNID|nr:hypothetical protein OS493_004359 [Desmophyllum pertusum]
MNDATNGRSRKTGVISLRQFDCTEGYLTEKADHAEARMNLKTAIVIVLVTALTTAVCSASRGIDEDIPYRQLLRELRKKGTSMRRAFDEAINIESKRDDDCDAVYGVPCSEGTVAAECLITTCEGKPMKCYPDVQTGKCLLEESASYRRSF